MRSSMADTTDARGGPSHDKRILGEVIHWAHKPQEADGPPCAA